jgi:hypothetical protein
VRIAEKVGSGTLTVSSQAAQFQYSTEVAEKVVHFIAWGFFALRSAN